MPSAARAQGRDTVVKRDTLVRRDTSAKRDTLVKTDSAARAAARVPGNTVPPADTTVRADTAPPHIPLPVDTVRRDTIKAPLAHAELPQTADPTGSYHLDRDEIFATGAQNVGDLLDRLPGVTQLRAGWMAAPMTATYLGDAARVRVFLDGVEYQSFDPHAGGSLDYSQIPLWPIEAVTVERSASEVRVYMNTWEVDRTTPYTRTDITTGDHQTNLYRGFFGRRFKHGESLQFGVEQYGTAPEPQGATSDQLSLMGRVGWAHGPFSVDAFMLQVRTHRGTITDPYSLDSLDQLDATRRDAYLRFGVGSPDRGPWLQAIAATTRYQFAGGATTVPTIIDSTKAAGDTTVSGAQYLLTGGFTRWGVRVSGAARYFASFNRAFVAQDSAHDTTTVQGSPAADSSGAPAVKPCCWRHGLFVPSVRADFNLWKFSVSAFAEGQGPDSVSRREANAVFAPFSFLRFAGAVGSERDARTPDSLLTPGYRRLEAGLRIHDLWLGGGTIMRGAVMLAAPALVNDSLTRVSEPSATATFISVRGRIWRGINADAFALKWNDSTGFYRPQYQTRAQLYISTSLLDRFPDNSFHIFFGATHEYQSATYFPVGAAGVERLPGYRTIGAQLEIRIERAVLSYRFTNALGEKYQTVPGFQMPRQSSVYGMRWYFWN